MSKYTTEFKLEVIKHYLSGRDGFKLTGTKFAVDDSLVRKWVDVYKCLGPDSFRPRYERRTAEFKFNVLKQIQSRGLSLREARREFNIGAESSILVWQKPPTKPLSELTQAELARYVEYLQAENAYLKKLEALVQSKKQAAQTKPK